MLYIFYKIWTEIEHGFKCSACVPYMDKFKNGIEGK